MVDLIRISPPEHREARPATQDDGRRAGAGQQPATAPILMDRDAGLAELFNVVYRQKWLIILTVLASALIAFVVLQQLTPRYSAQALLMIETRQTTIPNLDSVLTGLVADDQGVRSEVEVLRSRGLAAATIRELGLDSDAEFNKTGESSFANVVDAFLERLAVEPVKGSRVISVTFTSADPSKAAQIANTLADAYLLAQLETKFEAATMANAWLNERVEELRQQVELSEKAVEDFRRDAGLLQTQGVTLTAQQMAELNGQLVLARAATAQARARLRQFSGLIDSPDGFSSANEVLDSQLIQRLKEQQAQIERRVAELAAEYGPAHPRMIQLRAEQEDLQASIAAEVDKIAASLRNEVAIAAAREASLEQELTRLKEQMAQSNDNQIQLRALEREAEANRALLATLLARYKEVNSQDEIQSQQADARIISRADAPSDPSFPNKKFLLGIVILLSGLLAIIVAFLRQTLERGFVSGEQIESLTGVTSLGFVPLVANKGGDSAELLQYLVEYPRSALSQSLRTAHWSTTLSAGPEVKKIVITSSRPGEGKTTVATGIARTQALAGRRTLLIDADTRNPGVHTALGKSLRPGLLDVLRGEARTEVIVKDGPTNLDIVCAGQGGQDPLMLLDSTEMNSFLDRMEREYDVIVIDTPPLMAASDACALSRKADTTVLVVRWSSTPREAVVHAMRQLTRAGGHLAGALLTMVDVKKHAEYQYGDSGAYHGSLRQYYVESTPGEKGQVVDGQ